MEHDQSAFTCRSSVVVVSLTPSSLLASVCSSSSFSLPRSLARSSPPLLLFPSAPTLVRSLTCHFSADRLRLKPLLTAPFLLVSLSSLSPPPFLRFAPMSVLTKRRRADEPLRDSSGDEQQQQQAMMDDQQPDKKKAKIEGGEAAAAASSSSSSLVTITAASCPSQWLQQIHSFLEFDELKAAAFTCRHWYASAACPSAVHCRFDLTCVSHSALRNVLTSSSPLLSFMDGLGATPYREELPRLFQLSRMRHCRRLDVSLEYGSLTGAIELAPSPQLTALTLRFMRAPKQPLLDQLSTAVSTHCMSLQELNLDADRKRGFGKLDFAAFLRLPHVTQLHIGAGVRLEDKAMLQLLSAMRQLPLRRLRVESVSWTPAQLKALSTGGASRMQLEEIDLTQTDCSVAVLTGLLPFAGTLTHLSPNLMRAECFPLLRHFTRVQSCSIRFSRLEWPLHLHAWTELSALVVDGFLAQLTSLDLSHLELSEADLTQLVTHAPQLRRLGLAQCRVASYLPLVHADSLRELTLVGIDLHSSTTVQQLAECAQLESLSVDLFRSFFSAQAEPVRTAVQRLTASNLLITGRVWPQARTYKRVDGVVEINTFGFH